MVLVGGLRYNAVRRFFIEFKNLQVKFMLKIKLLINGIHFV